MTPKIEPQPGNIIQQFVRCGKKNCKCTQGTLHGPYTYHVWRVGKQRFKRYVTAENVTALQTACEKYHQEKRDYREFIETTRCEWRRLKALLKEIGL